nr:hypothetical protein [uncultured Halomonas sp.]
MTTTLHDEFWASREESDFGSRIKEYIEDTYSLIAASPHVMDVHPSKEECIQAFEDGDFGVSVWPMQSTISIDFINLRMVMPKRKREELGVFKSSWSPDEFNITFDGSIFLTYAAIDEIPVFTDLGQIAREYLKNLMDGSMLIDPYDGVGPTPIHPEIYIVKLQVKNDTEIDTENKIPRIKYAEGKVIILIPDEDDIEEVVESLQHDMTFYKSRFYQQRLMDRNLTILIDSLEEMNETLSEKLSEYFELTLFQRFLSKNPKEIRTLLATMHLCLQQITSAQFHAKRKRDEALKGISGSTFFDGIEEYFDDHMEDENDFDRESQLTSMNFAAEETGNFVLTQATLVAALAGALIGGAITSLSQYLTSGTGG